MNKIIVCALAFLMSVQCVQADVFVFSVAYSDNLVNVIDTNTDTLVASIAVGGGPSGIAITPDGLRAYVTNFDNNSVSIIDTVNRVVIGSPITAGIGTNPWGIAITPDGSKAYVANYYDGTVSVIDIASGVVVSTITGFYTPEAVAITPNGEYAYVSNSYDNTVSVIDIATDTIVGSPIVLPGTPPDVLCHALAVTLDGSELCVIVTDTVIPECYAVVISTTSNTVIGSPISLPNGGQGIAMTPNELYAYVVSQGSLIANVVDLASDSVVNNVPNTLALSIPLNAIAITANGAKAYIGGCSDMVVVDLTTNQISGVILGVCGYYGVAIATFTPPPTGSALADTLIAKYNSRVAPQQ